MTTLRASIELLKRQVRVKGTASEIVLKNALIDAMHTLKSEPLSFNEDATIIQLKQGVQSYSKSGPVGLVASALVPSPPSAGDLKQSLPERLTGFRTIRVKEGDRWQPPLTQKDHDLVRSWTVNESCTGTPIHYSVFHGAMHLFPIPHGDMECFIDYIFDVDRPRYIWNGSSFDYEERIFNATTEVYDWTSMADDNTYENPWLEFAEPVIRSWAYWYLAANVFHVEADQIAQAQFWYNYHYGSAIQESRRFREGGSRSVSSL